jgi:N-acetylgalactosamine-N,N'-diacetylbacillosaminyl-diphospho-undecaprenol 4-alpha-N-acetylgalactosaminyltransferase
MYNKERKPNISVLAMTMGSGGAEKVISLFLPELMKDYNVTLVLFYDIFHFEIPGDLQTEILIKGKKLSTLQKIFLFPIAFFRYLNFVKRNNIEVSVSFLTRPNFLNGLIKIFRKDRIKVIMSERNYPSIEYRSSRARYYLYKLLIPVLYSKADYLFSNSEWINKDLKENFGVSSPFKVIYNPIILPELSGKTSPGDQMIRFISVGRVIATKNQEMIIDAFSGIKEAYYMSFLGAGKLMEYLKNKIDTLGKSQHIKFIGSVKNVNDYLSESDCFILSSNSEGFPNAVVEAMAMGLPVISTNCLSGPLEILNNNEPVNISQGDFYIAKYGILINVGDVVGLRKAINYAINNRDFLIEYGQKSLDRATAYSINVIYAQLNSLIGACLN